MWDPLRLHSLPGLWIGEEEAVHVDSLPSLVFPPQVTNPPCQRWNHSRLHVEYRTSKSIMQLQSVARISMQAGPGARPKVTPSHFAAGSRLHVTKSSSLSGQQRRQVGQSSLCSDSVPVSLVRVAL